MAGELSKLALKHLNAGEPETPFKLAGIDHAVLLVNGMDKAMDFYCRVLGARPGYSYPHLAMEQVWCGPHLIVLIDIDDPQSEYAQPAIAGGRNLDHLCLSISPCAREELRNHLKANSVTIDGEAVHGGARGMGEATYVFDPSGNKIELKGPPLI